MTEQQVNIDNVEDVQALIDAGLDIPLKLNRKQRRALKKKQGKKGRQTIDVVNDTAKKLNYIDLIQKLRVLNEQKEKENYENANEDD